MTEILTIDDGIADSFTLRRDDPLTSNEDSRYPDIFSYFLASLPGAGIIAMGAFSLKKRRITNEDSESQDLFASRVNPPDPSRPPLTALPQARLPNGSPTPSASQMADPFYVRADLARGVKTIITYLADYGWARLSLNAIELMQIGGSIENLHPFAFIISIYKDPELRRRMPIISLESWKWNRLIGGIASSGERIGIANLLVQTGSLAREVGKDAAIITTYLRETPPNFQALTEYIFGCQKLT